MALLHSTSTSNSILLEVRGHIDMMFPPTVSCTLTSFSCDAKLLTTIESAKDIGKFKCVLLLAFTNKTPKVESHISNMFIFWSEAHFTTTDLLYDI
jgi:hypothetical protein